MIHIVIPMAGLGSRFAQAGYIDPKPLIPIHKKPMIQVVIDNLTPDCAHHFIFIVQKTHMEWYNLDTCLQQYAPDCTIIPIDYTTEGAACSVLLAQHIINTDTPLMIANCDQFVDVNITQYLESMGDFDGYIMTFKDNADKWSYIQYDDEGNIIGVVEKQVVSHDATVGIYNFAKGADFVTYAHTMIQQNLRVKGEFYVAPVYTMMVADGKKLGIYDMSQHNQHMYGLGVPEDVQYFLKHPISDFLKRDI